MPLFRTLSSALRRNSAHKSGNDNRNGASNGSVNGTSKPSGSFAKEQPNEPQKKKMPDRAEVESTFEQLAQLIHASQRPLPTQTGDGAYLDKAESTGLWDDLKAMGLKDVKTINDIMQDKASGLPQDDKKMHMEEIMQASLLFLRESLLMSLSSLQPCQPTRTIG